MADRLASIQLGMTREEVKAKAGEPDDMGVTSRKYKTPMIYVYGNKELIFAPWKSGKLLKIEKKA